MRELLPDALTSALLGAIESLLAAGTTIVCDRYVASSVAYGEAQGLDAGADDYLMKGHLARLLPAIERGLREAKNRVEKKRLERELITAKEAALDAARLKTKFLANMSHEIRTPMNGVIGMTSLLMETNLTSEQRSYADTIRQCGEALLQLINDVLECSKIEAGKLELERLAFDLRTTVEHVLAQFAERAEAKGLELTGLVHAAVPTGLKGDPGRLRPAALRLG